MRSRSPRRDTSNESDLEEVEQDNTNHNDSGGSSLEAGALSDLAGDIDSDGDAGEDYEDHGHSIGPDSELEYRDGVGDDINSENSCGDDHSYLDHSD